MNAKRDPTGRRKNMEQGEVLDDIGLHLGFKRRIECGHMETREPTLQAEETI